MIVHILWLIIGVQIGLALTLWRLGEQRQALRDEAARLDDRAQNLDRLWRIVADEKRRGCGR